MFSGEGAAKSLKGILIPQFGLILPFWTLYAPVMMSNVGGTNYDAL